MYRFVSSLVVVLLLAAVAPAQDWAKARLDKSPRHGEWVKLTHDKREVQSFVVYPEVKSKATAVVVIRPTLAMESCRIGVRIWTVLRPKTSFRPTTARTRIRRRTGCPAQGRSAIVRV